MLSEVSEVQLIKNVFSINSITKNVYGSDIFLNIEFSFTEIIDFDHYFRVSFDNGVVKSGNNCISSASFSYLINSICEDINPETFKIKNLLYSAPIGISNRLNLKILNP